MKYWGFLALLGVAACVSAPAADCPPLPAGKTAGDVVYVVGYDWHAEIGIPVEALGPELGFYRDLFPGAKSIMFGYGKKTFFSSPARSFSEYILGPVPGPAAIQVVGLNVMPDEAYEPEDVVVLRVTAAQGAALADFIWNDLEKDAAGKADAFAPSKNPAGLFYYAVSEYSLAHTCNTWVADGLQAAGLPVSGNGVVFAGQVMDRATQAAGEQCRFLR